MVIKVKPTNFMILVDNPHVRPMWLWKTIQMSLGSIPYSFLKQHSGSLINMSSVKTATCDLGLKSHPKDGPIMPSISTIFFAFDGAGNWPPACSIDKR